MALTLSESFHTGEYLLDEGCGSISREAIVLAAGPALPAGQVLGKLTASGKYAAYSNAAGDGTNVAVGILYAPAPLRTGDMDAVAHVRLCEVQGALLTGLDAPGTADLLTTFVVVR